MKVILKVVGIWLIFLFILFQFLMFKDMEIMKQKIFQLENESYESFVKIENLKLDVENYKETSERLFDQNLKLMREEVWK